MFLNKIYKEINDKYLNNYLDIKRLYLLFRDKY